MIFFQIQKECIFLTFSRVYTLYSFLPFTFLWGKQLTSHTSITKCNYNINRCWSQILMKDIHLKYMQNNLGEHDSPRPLKDPPEFLFGPNLLLCFISHTFPKIRSRARCGGKASFCCRCEWSFCCCRCKILIFLLKERLMVWRNFGSHIDLFALMKKKKKPTYYVVVPSYFTRVVRGSQKVYNKMHEHLFRN